MDMILDRSLYKDIKKMNRDQLNTCIHNIYEKGKKDAESINVDYDLLKADLGKIKGIGENRLNEIMTVIDKHIKLTNNEEGTEGDS